MRKNSIVSALLGISCVLVVAVLSGTPLASGAALWVGATNDFNASSNWVDDDSLTGPKNPSNQNCYIYKDGAGHLTDMDVTDNISVFSLGMHAGAWGGSTSPVTIGSSSGKTITINPVSDTGLSCPTAGMGLLTIDADLSTAYAGTQDWYAASNIVVNGDINIGMTTTVVRKLMDGTLTLNGATSAGRMQVSAGTLTLGSTGSKLIRAYDGDTYTGAIWGTGTLNLNGTLKVDAADLTVNTGSWIMIATDTLTENYGGTFAVAMASGAPFTNNGGVWSYVDGTKLWSFSQANGTLSLGVVPEPGTIILLVTGLIGLLAYAWRKRK